MSKGQLTFWESISSIFGWRMTCEDCKTNEAHYLDNDSGTRRCCICAAKIEAKLKGLNGSELIEYLKKSQELQKLKTELSSSPF